MNQVIKIVGYVAVFVAGMFVYYVYDQFWEEFNRTETSVPGEVILVTTQGYRPLTQERIPDATVTSNGSTSIRFIKVLQKLGYECTYENSNDHFAIPEILAKKGSTTIMFAEGKAYVNGKRIEPWDVRITQRSPGSFDKWTIRIFAFNDILREAEPNVYIWQQFNDVTINIDTTYKTQSK